jgi:hypothetical protein
MGDPYSLINLPALTATLLLFETCFYIGKGGFYFLKRNEMHPTIREAMKNVMKWPTPIDFALASMAIRRIRQSRYATQ